MSKQQKMRTNSIYAPLRYAATRPFARRLGTDFNVQVSLGMAARHKFISEKLLLSIPSELEQLGRQAGPGPAQAEIVNVQTFGSFMKGGALIFDLSDQVSTLLSTDISTVPLWALPAIADSFYLHFGRNEGLEQDDMSIEGVFVTWFKPKDEPSRLVLDFVKKAQFSRSDFWLVEAGEQCLGCSVDVSRPDLTLKDALERSVHQIVESNKYAEAQIEEAIKRMEALYGKSVVSVPAQISDLTSKLPVLRRGLSLVANSLLYLGATRAGQTYEPSSGPGTSSTSVFYASVIVC